MERPNTPLRERLVGAAFPDASDTDRTAAVNALALCDTLAHALAIIAVCDRRPDRVATVQTQRWPSPLRPSVEEWERYAASVADRIERPVDVGSTLPCVRCRSHNVSTMTKQLRRADVPGFSPVRTPVGPRAPPRFGIVGIAVIPLA